MSYSYNQRKKVNKMKKRLALMTISEYKKFRPEEVKGDKKIIDFMKEYEIRPRVDPKVKEAVVEVKEAKEKVNQMDQYKKYEVTFTVKGKYNIVTRSVFVRALNQYQAEMLIVQQFGSFKKLINKANKKATPTFEPSDKIKIISCVEIVDEVVTEETINSEKVVNV